LNFSGVSLSVGFFYEDSPRVVEYKRSLCTNLYFVLYFLLEIFTCRSIYDAFDIIFYMKQVYIIIFSLCISIVLQNNLLRRLDHSLDYFYDSSKRRLFTYI
jgi:hypothetical protein